MYCEPCKAPMVTTLARYYHYATALIFSECVKCKTTIFGGRIKGFFKEPK